jgi:hypothetical protein
VSWLRPSRTVVDPHGKRWEIYVTRSRIGAWNGSATADVDPIFQPRAAEVWWLLMPVMVVLEIVLGLLKLIALIPLSLAGVALRRQLRVEAITEHPMPQTYVWTVEKPALAHVLDEIAAGLEHGSIPRPEDALPRRDGVSLAR